MKFPQIKEGKNKEFKKGVLDTNLKVCILVQIKKGNKRKNSKLMLLRIQNTVSQSRRSYHHKNVNYFLKNIHNQSLINQEIL